MDRTESPSQLDDDETLLLLDELAGDEDEEGAGMAIASTVGFVNNFRALFMSEREGGLPVSLVGSGDRDDY